MTITQDARDAFRLAVRENIEDDTLIYELTRSEIDMILAPVIDAAEARQREAALDYDFCGDPNRPEWSDGYSEALADLEARLREGSEHDG
jgi:hypothetical protein